MVRPGGVGALVEFMDAHPAGGIAGSRLEFPDGRPQASAFRFHSVFGEIDMGLRTVRKAGGALKLSPSAFR